MKFGKYLREAACPAWADQYVDYKLLKKCLKPFEDGVANQADEDRFLACLHAEIEKVDTFFNQKEAEFIEKQRAFVVKVNQAKKIHVNRSFQSREELLAACEGTEMGQVIENFVAFTAKVDTLRDYVMLNLQAVIKITKKHDKHSDTHLQSDLVQQVHNRNFYRSEHFGGLILEIEKLAMQIMGRLTGYLESSASPKTSDVSSDAAPNYQCPACLEQLCNPIMLPCGHRFCMRCVSPASYFKKGYRCPVCQQELTLDVDTVKYGSLLSNGSLTLHTSVSGMFQPGGSVNNSKSNTPTKRRDSHPHSRHPTPHASAVIDSAQGREASDYLREDAEAVRERSTAAEGRVHTSQHGSSPVHADDALDYAEMERQMSERLRARERALDQARYRRNSKGSPLADLSQVAMSMSPHTDSCMSSYNCVGEGRTDLERHARNSKGRPRGVHGYEKEEPLDDGVPNAFTPQERRQPTLAYIAEHAGERGAREEEQLLPERPRGWTHAGAAGVRRSQPSGANDPVAVAQAGQMLAGEHQRWQGAGMTAGMLIRAVDGMLQVADIAPGGPAAITRQICKGDIVASVDPGKESLKVHWYWQQQGDRRWIDVRGWKEDELKELIELNEGHNIWFRMRRQDVEYVSRVSLAKKRAEASLGEEGSGAATSRPVVFVVAGGGRIEVPVAIAAHLRRSRNIDAHSHESSAECSADWVPFSDGPDAVWEFEILDRDSEGYALCTPANVCQVLAFLDGGFACACGLPPTPILLYNDIKSAIHLCVSTTDHHATYRRLAEQVQEAEGKLAANLEATENCRKHLAPLMALPELARHTVLQDVTAKIKAAHAFLEGEQSELEEQLQHLTDKRRRVQARIRQARAEWAALPSVATWASVRDVASCDEEVVHSGEVETARCSLMQSLSKACVLAAVASHLQFESVRQELLKGIASGLVECTNPQLLRWLLGLEGGKHSPDGAVMVQGLLDCALEKAAHGFIFGAPSDGAASEPHEVQVARAVCSTALRGNADAGAASYRAHGRGPLRSLDASLVVDLAAAVLDSGWRYLTVEGAQTDGQWGPGGGGSTLMWHVDSEVLLEVLHKNRQSTFMFRSTLVSEVQTCNWDGSLELGVFANSRAVSAKDTLAARAAAGSGTGIVPNERSVQEREGLFAGGSNQVGFWIASSHGGKIHLKNNGAHLYLTREGGFAFFPAQHSSQALVLEQGWARPTSQALAKAALNISDSAAGMHSTAHVKKRSSRGGGGGGGGKGGGLCAERTVSEDRSGWKERRNSAPHTSRSARELYTDAGGWEVVGVGAHIAPPPPRSTPAMSAGKGMVAGMWAGVSPSRGKSAKIY